MPDSTITRALLRPSSLSGLSIVVVSLVFMSASAWSYISHEQLFYAYLFGQFGIVTALLQAPDFFAVFQRTILNNPLTYDTMILACAILIGLLVYQLLEGLSRVAEETSHVWYEFHTHTPSARAAMNETLVRLLVRSVSFACWVVYVLFFVNILLPFCLLLLQSGLDIVNTSPWIGAAADLAATIFLALSLHLHVVFLRLCFLRLRLFGGWVDV